MNDAIVVAGRRGALTRTSESLTDLRHDDLVATLGFRQAHKVNEKARMHVV